jgi:hypothetical protein
MVALTDKKDSIIEAVLNHPTEPTPYQVADEAGKDVEKLTKLDWWRFYANLVDWKPMTVKQVTEEWFHVASSSSVDTWHAVNPNTGFCTCEYGIRRSSYSDSPECKHPEAVRSFVEKQINEMSENLFFTDAQIIKNALVDTSFQAVQLRETFVIQDARTDQNYGYLFFDEDTRDWCLVEVGKENLEPIRLDSATEAINMLTAIVSLGWQIA